MNKCQDDMDLIFTGRLLQLEGDNQNKGFAIV